MSTLTTPTQTAARLGPAAAEAPPDDPRRAQLAAAKRALLADTRPSPPPPLAVAQRPLTSLAVAAAAGFIAGRSALMKKTVLFGAGRIAVAQVLRQLR